MSNTNIVFAGLGRLRDQLTLIAVYDRLPSNEKNEIRNAFQQALTEGAARYSAGARDKRPYNGGMLYISVDQQLCGVYAIALRSTKKKYPERVAFAFLQDFTKLVTQSDHASNLNSTVQKEWTPFFRKPVKELMSTYDDPANVDKTASVQSKVEHTKGIMQENISKVLATHADLTDLEGKTDMLQINAEAFQQGARKAKLGIWRDAVKITIIIAIVFGATLTYVVFMLINTFRH